MKSPVVTGKKEDLGRQREREDRLDGAGQGR